MWLIPVASRWRSSLSTIRGTMVVRAVPLPV